MQLAATWKAGAVCHAAVRGIPMHSAVAWSMRHTGPAKPAHLGLGAVELRRQRLELLGLLPQARLCSAPQWGPPQRAQQGETRGAGERVSGKGESGRDAAVPAATAAATPPDLVDAELLRRLWPRLARQDALQLQVQLLLLLQGGERHEHLSQMSAALRAWT